MKIAADTSLRTHPCTESEGLPRTSTATSIHIMVGYGMGTKSSVTRCVTRHLFHSVFSDYLRMGFLTHGRSQAILCSWSVT